MLMLALFFLVMAAVNFGIFRMHEKKADLLASERAQLSLPDKIAANEKAHQQRLNAAKTGKIATGFLGVGGILMLVFTLTSY